MEHEPTAREIGKAVDDLEEQLLVLKEYL